MDTPYKYKIVKGEIDTFTDQLHTEGFSHHLPDRQISFNNKTYKVAKMPYKNSDDNFYTVEIEQIQN